MHACSDESAFDWIRLGREGIVGNNNDPDWKGIPVARLLPRQFSSYIKILHRLDAHYENIDNPLSPEEIAILQIPSCDAVRTFVENLRKARLGTRILWKEIAEHLGAPFQPQIVHDWFVERLKPNQSCWPRFIWGPAEGTLDVGEKEELVSKLLPFTQGACFFRWAEMPFVGTDKTLVFEGDLKQLPAEWNPANYPATPEYWWPGDHSWCVCSDYDLYFTIVGCSENLAEEILKSNVLESVRVTPETRIDFRTPMADAQ